MTKLDTEGNVEPTITVTNDEEAEIEARETASGEPLDPAATDWDATAWQIVCADLGLDVDVRDEFWPLYQAELVAETERLCEMLGEQGGERIETEDHRRAVAWERLSRDWPIDQPFPEGTERQEAIDEWLSDHPEIVVGSTAASA